jgi:CRP-like cAMP-binding protein
LRYVAPVDTFGVVAVLSEAEFPVSAQAVDVSEVLVWSKSTINSLMLEIPQIAVNGMSILAGRVREFQQRIVEMSTERVERRIARALLRLAQQTGRKTDEGVLIDMPLSRQDLAEMTGTTLYTVSRMLSQWESKGLIHSGREKIVIVFPHGLVAIAEDLPKPSID